jgi:hypothetical protein
MKIFHSLPNEWSLDQEMLEASPQDLSYIKQEALAKAYAVGGLIQVDLSKKNGQK